MEAPLGDSLGPTGCGAAQREGRREAHPGGLGRRAGPFLHCRASGGWGMSCFWAADRTRQGDMAPLSRELQVAAVNPAHRWAVQNDS